MPSKEIQAFLEQRAQLPRPNPADPPPDIAVQRSGFDQSMPSAGEDIRVQATGADGVAAEWVLAPDADERRRILYLHGGGYAIGSPRSHRRLASDVARASGCAVLNLDYRLAPEHPYPAQLDDALVAYEWIQRNGPAGPSPSQSVFVAGDSAGGGLTLALLLALRDRGETQPNGAITLSAWTDMTASGYSVAGRAHRDPLMTGPDALAMAASRFLGSADPRLPYASPVFGSFEGVAPLFMNVGDDELLLDDTLRVAERASRAGVDVTLHVQPEGFHVYPLFVPDAPESRHAIEAIANFIRARS